MLHLQEECRSSKASHYQQKNLHVVQKNPTKNNLRCVLAFVFNVLRSLQQKELWALFVWLSSLWGVCAVMQNMWCEFVQRTHRRAAGGAKCGEKRWTRILIHMICTQARTHLTGPVRSPLRRDNRQQQPRLLLLKQRCGKWPRGSSRRCRVIMQLSVFPSGQGAVYIPAKTQNKTKCRSWASQQENLPSAPQKLPIGGGRGRHRLVWWLSNVLPVF